MSFEELVTKYNPNLGQVALKIKDAALRTQGNLRRAFLDGMTGEDGTQNGYGEEVKKLDEKTNRLFTQKVGDSGLVNSVYSEEFVEPVRFDSGDYMFCIDPLDGSGNIDLGLNIGTIISLYKHNGKGKLPKGEEQVLAAYILYSYNITIVITFKDSPVFMLQYDLNKREFVLIKDDLKIPEDGIVYTLNEGNENNFTQRTKNFVENIKGTGKAKSRNMACMVADVHRVLLSGGIFMYPDDINRPNGKLRLLYEVNPMSMIIQNAGGASVSNHNNPLELSPKSHDQEVPIVLGSKNLVEIY